MWAVRALWLLEVEHANPRKDWLGGIKGAGNGGMRECFWMMKGGLLRNATRNRWRFKLPKRLEIECKVVGRATSVHSLGGYSHVGHFDAR